MRAVVQRVSRAKVTVEGRVSGEIGPGLMILLGVGKEDTSQVAAAMAEKWPTCGFSRTSRER